MELFLDMVIKEGQLVMAQVQERSGPMLKLSGKFTGP